MKQKQVIDKLIADTESGEMVWRAEFSRIANPIYNTYWSGDYQFNHGISQRLDFQHVPIIGGLWMLRALGVAIQKQLKYAEDDKISEIYNKILTE